MQLHLRKTMQKIIGIVLIGWFIAAFAAEPTIRVKDLGKLKGWRDNALVGYGIVTGLAGTGDAPSNRGTRQALTNALAQFNLTVPVEQVQVRNVALVMLTASLPPFAKEGDTFDVTVASVGDARSLVGGSLLLTPLKGADGRVYALAQGPLSVGGYRYDANGNVVQKNHPTVGSIPGGASVEVGVTQPLFDLEKNLIFVLAEPDYTTANRIAAAINTQVGAGLAQAIDASGIEIQPPPGSRENLTRFLARIENVNVEPDRRAKVVINERTGTIVSGGDVRISKVVIAHGDLKISVASQNSAAQPILVSQPGAGIRTAIVSNSVLNAEEQNNPIVADSTTIADLLRTLAKLKINTRDMISIVRAIKAAGALHAELVII